MTTARRRPGKINRQAYPGPLALSMPAVIVAVLFFAVPLALFFVYSFLTAGLYSVSGPLTVESYRDAIESDFNRTLARNSFVIGIATAISTVALATPIAYWLRYSAGRLRMPVLFLITASMFASYLVRIYAWRTILGSNGVLNSGLERLGVIDEPIGFLLYNRFAVTIALVHIFVPYVVLVMYAGLAPVPSALLDCGRDLGAGAMQRWRRIVLPLVAAPAATSFLFVFVLSAADYVTPQFLGGTSGVMLGVQIQTSFISTGNWPLGAALSFLMLAAFAACYALVAFGLRMLKLDRIVFTR